MPRNPSLPRWRAHLAELVVLGIAAVVIIGLWVGNRGGDEDTGGSTGTTLAAGDPGTAPSVPTSDPGASDGGAAEGSIQAAVLRAGDLPGGWSSQALEGPAGPLCDGHDPLGDAKPSDTARSAFRSDTQVLGGSVAAFSSTDQARDLLQRLRAAAGACAAAGGGASYRVVDVADVGDESVGIAFTVPGEQATVRGLIYVARVGNRSAAITATSTGDQVDDELALQALRAEVGRL